MTETGHEINVKTLVVPERERMEGSSSWPGHDMIDQGRLAWILHARRLMHVLKARRRGAASKQLADRTQRDAWAGCRSFILSARSRPCHTMHRAAIFSRARLWRFSPISFEMVKFLEVLAGPGASLPARQLNSKEKDRNSLSDAPAEPRMPLEFDKAINTRRPAFFSCRLECLS